MLYETRRYCTINILFTTIQDLHGKLNNITEYSVSYEDFDDKKLL